MRVGQSVGPASPGAYSSTSTSGFLVMTIDGVGRRMSSTRADKANQIDLGARRRRAHNLKDVSVRIIGYDVSKMIDKHVFATVV